MIRVALFTSQDIGFELAQHFEARADLLVISYDQAKYADYGYRSALTFCRERGIRHVDAPKADDRVAVALDAHRPDIIVCAWYAKILPTDLLAKARLGGVNVHPGKLPFYKGRWPTPWYILNGDPTFGIAVHKMVAEVDAGDVFVQREFPIPPDMTGHELIRETMKRSAEAVIDSFEDIVSGRLIARPQVSGGSRYDHMDKTYEIDWASGSDVISRHIRVHAKPYEPASGVVGGRRISINRAKPIEGSRHLAPGSVLSRDPLVVQCGEGALRVDDYEWLH